MSASTVALFLHLLGVLALVAGVAAAALAHAAARRRDAPGEVAALLSVARSGVLLAAPGALLVVGGGFWLAAQEDLGPGTGWLAAAVVVFVLATGLGAAGGRTPKRARLTATALAAEGRGMSPELRGLLDDRRAAALNLLSTAGMVVVLALMVFKP